MKFSIVLLLLILRASCEIYGVRLFLGSYYTPQGGDQMLSIWFNSDQDVGQMSVVTSQMGSQLIHSCSSRSVSVTNQTTFNTYVYRCSIRGIVAGVNLTYLIPGVKNSTIKLVDKSSQEANRFLVFADWSPLLIQKYIPISQHLVELRRFNQSDFHGVLIQGDIAYNLETDECKNYVRFIKMLAGISEVWPIVFSTGNHEWISSNNWKLYSESFQVYGLLSDRRIQTYSFRWLNVVTLDPYLMVYNKMTQEEKTTFLDGVKQEFYKLPRKQWTVPTSHYPVLCSAETKCQDINITLSPLWNIFNDFKVNLYLSGHAHTYQRIYPYYRGKVMPVPGPYNNIDSLICIVEGVAGNDQGMAEKPYNLKEYTASATFNETGFGVMTANNTHILYQHYSTKGGLHLADSVVVTRPVSQQLRRQ